MNLILKFTRNAAVKQFFAFCLIFLLTGSSALMTFAQSRRTVGKAAVKGKINNPASRKQREREEREERERERERDKEQKKLDEKNALLYPDGERSGEKMTAPVADEKTVIQIMAEQAAFGSNEKSTRQMMMEKGLLPEKEGPNRKNLPDGLGALPFSRFPYPSEKEKPDSLLNLVPTAPQTLGTQFNGATGPTETGAFPPDTQGVVGPSQFVVFLNGRLRTFNKTTGVADGVLNADSDVFFASVMTPPAAGEVTFTTDPNVRYDRLSGRWFLNIIDVTLSTATGATTRVNRVIIAVSDAASNGVISGTTVWTFYQFTGDATLFTDYQSFGIDQDAMYIGGNMFTLAGAFNSTKGLVIPKAPALSGSPLTIWAFSGLVATSTGAGPFAPRGVDNPDPTNTGPTALGYFIGVDNATFNTLMIRRVTNPGSLALSPTISANVSVATPLTTRFPVKVPHLGNTGGTNGRLDALDDRLYAATMRNGRLWTAHNIGVNNTGVAGATNNRNAARWYELQNLPATPSVVQSGTLFDNNATNDVNQRNYWLPSVMVSGQGHAAMGMSIAGTNERINAFTTGRLVGDTLGTMRDGPGGTAFPGYTASATAYNPAGDPGGTGGRRWGDYSFTSLDPKDDMTMWTIQEYCNGANTYGVQVVKLIAPPPASIADGPNAGLYNVQGGLPSVNVTITGTSVSGSGFYDPGPNLPAPALPFNHITASVSGTNVIVNSVTYNSPTSITLNLNTVGATLTDSNLSPATVRNLTIVNPDGQSVTRAGILNILAPTAAGVTVQGKITKADGTPIRGAAVELFSNSTSTTLTGASQADGTYLFQNVPSGANYLVTPSKAGYEFSPNNRLVNLVGDVTDVDFSAAPDAAHARATVNDFDGDGISDYAVFRPTDKVWYIFQSSTSSMRTEIFGLASDTPAAADYDGDGKTDAAMWRASNGVWYIKQSSDGAVVSKAFGTKNDIPVYGYFDADGRVDLAIFRPSTATWWIQDSSTGNTRTARWGLATDKPVPQDYDGDGLTDLAVFRPENGTWYIINSSNGTYSFRQFGLSADQPVLGDYDGDGRADLTVYRASEGIWYRLESASSAFKVSRFGLSDDSVVGGDYDGDGKSDISLFRESDSKWYVMTSLNQSDSTTHWGKTGDIPIVHPAIR
jgi:hypothetical protein